MQQNLNWTGFFPAPAAIPFFLPSRALFYFGKLVIFASVVGRELLF
jgi:hypothetical protein